MIKQRHGEVKLLTPGHPAREPQSRGSTRRSGLGSCSLNTTHHKSKRRFTASQACECGIFHALTAGCCTRMTLLLGAIQLTQAVRTLLCEPAAASLLPHSGSHESEGERAVLILLHHSAFSFCSSLHFHPPIPPDLPALSQLFCWV